MAPPVLYLDTNHLSALARRPNDASSISVRQILDRRDATLALSLLHLHELSAPQFTDRDVVGEMLDRSPIVWAISFIELFDREVRHAFQTVTGGEARPVVVFYSDLRHAWSAPDLDEVPPIVEQLRAFAKRPDLRSGFLQTASRGVWLDGIMKTSAAVLRDPKAPILSRIKDMKLDTTQTGIVLPKPYPAEELLKRAGGLAAFPAYNVFQQLHRIRLGDGRFATKANDLLDEWHACYYPYADVTALDRATVARCRSARLPGLDRVTARLGDVPALLAQRRTV